MSKEKPKLSVYQAINKSMILWGLNRKEKMRVYYKWELEKRDKPMKIPCIIVDYSVETREWSIYIHLDKQILSCVIDDITGTGSIKSFNDVN